MTTSPSDFEEIKKEYLERKCRAFCTDYGIGVSSALFLFGGKKRPKVKKVKKRKKPEDPEVTEYKRVIAEHLEGRQELTTIPDDIDPYYSKESIKASVYYH